MMTSEQVYEMAAKLNNSNSETVPAEEEKEEIQPVVEETNTSTNDNTEENNNSTNDNVVSDSKQELETSEESSTESETDEKQNKTDNKTDKKTLSHSDKEKYAFTKLKNKEKQKREKLINDYEDKIKKLSAEIDKYKNLKKSDFNDDESYIDFRVDQKSKENEALRLQQEKAKAEQEEFEELNQQRIMNCFPDEKDREIYNNLLQSSAKPFVDMLSKADPENAVLSYLDDSDVAPILIRMMLTKPEIRNEILSKHNAYGKYMAIDNLAKKVQYAKSIIDKKRESPKTEQTDKPLVTKKQSIPVVGKVAKSESSTTIDKNSPNYWNNYLHELNQRRGR